MTEHAYTLGVEEHYFLREWRKTSVRRWWKIVYKGKSLDGEWGKVSSDGRRSCRLKPQWPGGHGVKLFWLVDNVCFRKKGGSKIGRLHLTRPMKGLIPHCKYLDSKCVCSMAKQFAHVLDFKMPLTVCCVIQVLLHI